ncbi:gene transfer agent family protein [Brucella intermedia]|uniref:gene transfer agent family protein n=1 Tax=Brucella intermedia TaxID=94625 RepID=UPI00224B47F9|nr:gene transfer agent family protein [Brucella intermedia]
MTKPNLSAEIVLPYGDGDHLFAIKGKQLETLEKLCDATISEISHRVMGMVPKYADLYNVILLGLEGGGMPSVEAKQFMERYFVGKPIASPKDPHSSIVTAAKIMEAVWFGVEDIETEKSSGNDADKKKE